MRSNIIASARLTHIHIPNSLLLTKGKKNNVRREKWYAFHSVLFQFLRSTILTSFLFADNVFFHRKIIDWIETLFFHFFFIDWNFYAGPLSEEHIMKLLNTKTSNQNYGISVIAIIFFINYIRTEKLSCKRGNGQ